MAIFIVGKFQKFFPKNFGNFPFFLFPVKIGKVFPVLSRNWKYFPEIFLSEIFSYYLGMFKLCETADSSTNLGKIGKSFSTEQKVYLHANFM